MKKFFSILLIISLLLVFSFGIFRYFKYRNAPIEYKYYHEIENISGKYGHDLRFFSVENMEYLDIYILTYSFNPKLDNRDNPVTKSTYISEALNIFQSIVQDVNDNPDNPLYQKRIELCVFPNDNLGNGTLIIRNFSYECDEFIPTECLTIDVRTIFIDDFDGIERACDSLCELHIAGIKNVDINKMKRFSKLKYLDVINCCYEDNQDISEDDFSEMKNNNPDLKIIVR